jgi:predicted HAD superfamily Cof-like phosphohydrolase
MIEIELVKMFHQKYNIPILDNPSKIQIERVQLRITLLHEEIKELFEADSDNNIQEIAKEACDVHYVLLGTVLELGYYTDFVHKTVFEKITKQGQRADCLNTIQTAFEVFKEDWSKTNLEKLLWAVEAYISSVDLQSHYLDIFKEVHRSNMSKGTDGKPVIREDGKIMKGEDFQLADLAFLETPQYNC